MTAGDPKAFAPEFERAMRATPPGERKFVLVGILNRHLRGRRKAVLVGGAAVELYTAGAYVTGDVDLVAEREEVVSLLEGAGFQRMDRLFFREDLELAVDIVGSTLRPGVRITTLTVGGYEVQVVSVEDAIVDRLLAAKFWKSRTDWEQAGLLWEAHGADVDLEELRTKAHANDIMDRLDELLARASEGQADGTASGTR